MYGARMFPWWTEKQKRLAEDLAQFVDEELFPLSREYERSLKFPWKIARKVADKGLFSIGFPEKYGGSGEDYGTVGKCIVNEELGRIGFGMITFYGTTVYGLGSPLTHFGKISINNCAPRSANILLNSIRFLFSIFCILNSRIGPWSIPASINIIVVPV